MTKLRMREFFLGNAEAFGMPGIKFSQIGTPYGYKILVAEADFTVANRIVLSISHTNPKY